MQTSTERLDRLESLVEHQQEVIERQQAILDEYQAQQQCEQSGEDTSESVVEQTTGTQTPSISRRSALTAGGMLALLGLGVGPVSASTPSGRVGTSDRPLEALYTESLNGGLTSGQSLSTLAGDGLQIDEGSLEVDTESLPDGNGESNWESTEIDETDVLQPADDDVVGLSLSKDGLADIRTDLGGSFLDFSVGVYGEPARGLRIESSGFGTPSIIGGADSNTVEQAEGATIGGGGANQAQENFSTVGGGDQNLAGGILSTVGGGRFNVSSGAVSTVAGGDGNVAEGTSSTVGGGSYNSASGKESTVSGGKDNVAVNAYSTVGGGLRNEASGIQSTVGGGYKNKASGDRSAIGGGELNITSGDFAIIPGGAKNLASGNHSFVVGRMATAEHDGAVVFGDSSDDGISSESADEARFQMPVHAPEFIGVHTEPSARAFKTNLEPIDPQAILEDVRSLSLTTWEYIDRDSGRHIGPMAEEFYRTFDLGANDRSITSIDRAGVALAAIQGIADRNEVQTSVIESLTDTIEELRDRVAQLEQSGEPSER